MIRAPSGHVCRRAPPRRRSSNSKKKKRNFAEEGRGKSEEREREVSRNGTRRKKGRGDDKILE